MSGTVILRSVDGLEARCDLEHGGVMYSLKYRGGPELLNRNRVSWGYDWGREWQFALFEGPNLPGVPMEDLFVAATQAAGDVGRVKNPVIDYSMDDGSLRVHTRLLEYYPRRSSWSPYKRQYFDEHFYPETAWRGRFGYYLTRKQVYTSLFGPRDFPAVIFTWYVWDVEHIFPPVEHVEPIIYFERFPANWQVMIEGRRDLQSWRKATIRADALPLWSDRFEQGLVIDGFYERGGGKGTICTPAEPADWLSVSISIDRTNANYIAGQMEMLVLEPDVHDVIMYRKGK